MTIDQAGIKALQKGELKARKTGGHIYESGLKRNPASNLSRESILLQRKRRENLVDSLCSLKKRNLDGKNKPVNS